MSSQSGDEREVLEGGHEGSAAPERDQADAPTAGTQEDLTAAEGDERDAAPERDQDEYNALHNWYVGYRKELVELAHYHSKALDTHILAVASGVLAFTAVFVSPQWGRFSVGESFLLVLGWVFLLAAVASTLASLPLGRLLCESEIRALTKTYDAALTKLDNGDTLDAKDYELKSPWYCVLITVLSWISVVVLFIGIALVCAFALVKVYHATDFCKEEDVSREMLDKKKLHGGSSPAPAPRPEPIKTPKEPAKPSKND